MPLAPVDVEAVAVEALGAVLSVPVATRVPNPRPAAGNVRVTRTGGSSGNVVQDDATVLVECWGPDGVAAFELARSAWAYLSALEGSTVGGVWVYEVRPQGPVNFPDPDTDSPRYQFVASIRCRMSEV